VKANHFGSQVSVKRNKITLGSFNTPISRVVVFGLGGDDSIKLNSQMTVSAQLHGGDGNDTFSGGGGSTIALGGAGNDRLKGGRGKSVLIGGGGLDRLTGGGQGGDILIGGTTAYDSQDQALTAILAEWRSSRTYNDRVARLRAGTGVPKLDATTVVDDLLANQLVGGGGLDWYFKGDNDVVSGRKQNEFQDAI
jgi:hypothetical protein